mmetsp:Transcript_10412/g.25327  ORF Transcript_10412/g.25327 Transcript_10412/m.25327 type:complete len:244 (-) Transcript_10412:143-874(-)
MVAHMIFVLSVPTSRPLTRASLVPPLCAASPPGGGGTFGSPLWYFSVVIACFRSLVPTLVSSYKTSMPFCCAFSFIGSGPAIEWGMSVATTNATTPRGSTMSCGLTLASAKSLAGAAIIRLFLLLELATLLEAVFVLTLSMAPPAASCSRSGLMPDARQAIPTMSRKSNLSLVSVFSTLVMTSSATLTTLIPFLSTRAGALMDTPVLPLVFPLPSAILRSPLTGSPLQCLPGPDLACSLLRTT